MKRLLLALSLLGITAAQADVTYLWNHPGTDVSNGVISDAPTQLAFQVEWSVDGGPLQYVDIPAGKYVNPTTQMSHTDTATTVLCQQTLVARIRAIYRGQQSAWSAQAQRQAQTCPTPNAPTNMTVQF